MQNSNGEMLLLVAKDESSVSVSVECTMLHNFQLYSVAYTIRQLNEAFDRSSVEGIKTWRTGPLQRTQEQLPSG